VRYVRQPERVAYVHVRRPAKISRRSAVLSSTLGKRDKSFGSRMESAVIIAYYRDRFVTRNDKACFFKVSLKYENQLTYNALDVRLCYFDISNFLIEFISFNYFCNIRKVFRFNEVESVVNGFLQRMSLN